MITIKLEIPKELLIDFVKRFSGTHIDEIKPESSRIKVIPPSSITRNVINKWLGNQ